MKDVLKEIGIFILDNWVWLSPILLEFALRLYPTDKDTSMLSNAFKLLNRIIPNIRKPKPEDKAALQSDGTLKNVVAVNTKRHIVPVILLLTMVSFGVSAQIAANFKTYSSSKSDSTLSKVTIESLWDTYTAQGTGSSGLYWNYQSKKWRILVDSSGFKVWRDLGIGNSGGAFWPLTGSANFTGNVTIDQGTRNWSQTATSGNITIDSDGGTTSVQGDNLSLFSDNDFVLGANGEGSIGANRISIATGTGQLQMASGVGGIAMQTSSTGDIAITSNDNFTVNAINNINVRLTDLATYDVGMDVVVDSVSLTALTIDGEARITAQGIAGIDPGIRLNAQSASSQSVLNIDPDAVRLKINNDGGTTGEFLGSDGLGGLVWATPAGGGSPAGSDTEIQYNASGSFGAESAFTWNRTDNYIEIDINSGLGTMGIGSPPNNAPAITPGIKSLTPSLTIAIQGPDGTAGTPSPSGGVEISGGYAYQVSGNNNGGDVFVTGGLGRGTGINGDVQISSATAGCAGCADGDIVLNTGTKAGGILVPGTTANASQGRATLVGGTVTVNNTKVTANSNIYLTSQVDGGTPGFLRISARSAGTSFTITSSSGTDTSTVGWIIIERD